MLWMTLMDRAFTFFRQLKTTPGKREKMSHCKCFAYNSKNVDCAELSTCFYFHSLKQISILFHTKNPFFCYCTLLAIKLNSSVVQRNSFYCTTFAKSFQTDFFCRAGGKQSWVISEILCIPNLCHFSSPSQDLWPKNPFYTSVIFFCFCILHHLSLPPPLCLSVPVGIPAVTPEADAAVKHRLCCWGFDSGCCSALDVSNN